MIELIRTEKHSENAVKLLLEEFCVMFRLYTKRMCVRLVNDISPIIIYAMQHQPNLTAHDVCAVVLQAHDCGKPMGSQFQFQVDIEGEFPAVNVSFFNLL